MCAKCANFTWERKRPASGNNLVWDRDLHVYGKAGGRTRISKGLEFAGPSCAPAGSPPLCNCMQAVSVRPLADGEGDLIGCIW